MATPIPPESESQKTAPPLAAPVPLRFPPSQISFPSIRPSSPTLEEQIAAERRDRSEIVELEPEELAALQERFRETLNNSPLSPNFADDETDDLDDVPDLRLPPARVDLNHLPRLPPPKANHHFSSGALNTIEEVDETALSSSDEADEVPVD